MFPNIATYDTRMKINPVEINQRGHLTADEEKHYCNILCSIQSAQEGIAAVSRNTNGAFYARGDCVIYQCTRALEVSHAALNDFRRVTVELPMPLPA